MLYCLCKFLWWFRTLISSPAPPYIASQIFSLPSSFHKMIASDFIRLSHSCTLFVRTANAGIDSVSNHGSTHLSWDLILKQGQITKECGNSCKRMFQKNVDQHCGENIQRNTVWQFSRFYTHAVIGNTVSSVVIS